MGKLFSYILSFTIIAHASYAQQPVNPAAEIRKNIDHYTSRLAGYGVAGQVLVAHHDTIVINKSYGLAIRDKNRLVTDETIFELASTSKMFTACAILVLEQDKLLSVTDRLDKFFPVADTLKQSITIHQLLTHTSGIPGGDLVNDFAPVSKAELIRLILSTPLNSKPGTGYAYSNAGYNLLAAIIEKVAGRSYEEYLDQTFFIPLGMHHTFVNGTYALKGQRTAHAYRGHTDNGGPERQVFNPRTWGGGSICSTVSDLYRWMQSLRQHTLLTAVSWQKFSTPHIKFRKDNNYGYGCFVYSSQNGQILDAIGTTERGFNCTIRLYLDNDVTVISLSNSSQPLTGTFTREFLDPRIAHFIFRSEKIAMPPATVKTGTSMKQLPGKYVSGNDTITISRQGDVYALQATGLSAASFIKGYSTAMQNNLHKVTDALTTYLDNFIDTRAHYFEKILSPGQLPDYIKERNDALQQYGPLRSYTIRSVFADRDTNFIITHTTMRFKNKTINYLIFWNTMDNKIGIDYSELGAAEVSMSATFATISDEELISYNLLNAATEATIRVTNDQQVMQLTSPVSPLVFKRL